MGEFICDDLVPNHMDKYFLMKKCTNTGPRYATA